MTIHISVIHTLAAVFSLLAICGASFLLLTIFSAIDWRRVAHPATTFTPAISILKPLHGTDPGMYEAFRSHCLQDYSDFEIIFGVSDPRDPAIAEVERLQREFPERRIVLVQCPLHLGANGKVSTLAQMLPQARCDFILINDSDIRVEPDFLRKVAAEFSDPDVGLVTALYRAQPGESLASRIEAITIATDFAAGVLSARVVEGGIHFALGSTIAIRRGVLNAIGGLEPLADFLADDYELGARTSATGSKIALADTVVETHLPSYGFSGMIDHQLRWARTIRDRRLGGFVGLGFTFALPWALLAFAFVQNPMTLGLLIAVFTLRMSAAWILCSNILHDRRTIRDLWLVPLRDFLGLYVWIVSFAGNSVIWRGEAFTVKHGRLSRR